MKTMIKSAAVLALLMAVPVWANVTFTYGSKTYTTDLMVKVNGYAGPTNWQGGAFEIQVANGTLQQGAISIAMNGTIAGLQGNLGGPGEQKFNSFCIESETPNLLFAPTLYVATIDTWAADGDGGASGGVDPISGATAWIYRQYLAGGNQILKSVTGDGAGVFSNKDISEALWYLEDETLGVNNVGNQLVETALAQATGLGGVRALNLWTLTWSASQQNWNVVDIQSQLVMIPAPGAAALAFLGLGIVGWVKRRMA